MMLLPFLLSALALWAGPGSALSSHRAPNGTCTTKLTRRPWHSFTSCEKRAYIDAELCLMERPATLGFPGAKNRFEELQYIHVVQAYITHNVGAFLSYHRLHMYAHEHLLREECGYRGAQPYWDEARDAGNFNKSVVLDPITGFGGNGAGEQGCIVDGPFANYTNGLGPGYWVGDHCINRAVNDTLSVMAGREYIDWCYKEQTFVDFWICAEVAPHSGGHLGVGGKMADGIASPGDPIFYLHHTWLDKIFWEWQALDLPARLNDMGGYNGLDGPMPVLPTPEEIVAISGPPIIFPDPSSFPPAEAMVPPEGTTPPLPAGDAGNITTLAHILNMYGVIPDATIADVMDIGGALLCYEYV